MSFVFLFINNYCIVKYFTSESRKSHSTWLIVRAGKFLQHKEMYSFLVNLDGALLWKKLRESPGKPIHPHQSD